MNSRSNDRIALRECCISLRGLLILLLLTLPASAQQNTSQKPTTGKGVVPTERGQLKRERYLGIATSVVPDAVVSHLNGLINPGQGLIVWLVLPGSPAETAGLKRHDVLVSYNRTPLTGGEQLRELIAASKLEDKVALELIRAGQRHTVEATLATRQARAVAEFAPNVAGQLLVAGGLLKNGEPRATALQQTITVNPSGKLTLRIAFSDADGKHHSREIEGSPAQTQAQLAQLPKSVAERVRQNVDRLAAADARQPRFRFRLQPLLGGENRVMRVILQRRDADDSVHLFEVDVSVPGEGRFKLAKLLENKALRQELDQLAPEIRRRIEGTLKNVEAPVMRFEQQRSQ